MTVLNKDALEAALSEKVGDFVASYEMRDPDYTPNAPERALIEDAIHSFLSDVWQATTGALPAVGQKQVAWLTPEQIRRLAPGDHPSVFDNITVRRAKNDTWCVPLYAAPPSPDTIRVKGLRWEQPDGPEGTSWIAHGTDACQFYVHKVGDEWMLQGPTDYSETPFDSLDAAKAAAQSDYESRIRSALASPPSLQSAQGSEGWKLVPIEPTEAMYDGAGKQATTFANFIRRSDFYHAYKAMLAASPVPAKQAGDGV